MKKEFAKWILDISKYMVTALLLSSVFNDMSNPIYIIVGIIGALICLLWGLWILNEQDKEDKKKGRKK